MDQVAGAAAHGIDSLWGIAPIVTILILIIMVLLVFIRALLLDIKGQRDLYLQTIKDNTLALNSLKEIISVALSK